MSTSWHNYPSIFNLGHHFIEDLLKDDVLVEEKIDGSQFSFGVFEEDGKPVLKCRSKGQDIYIVEPEKMFAKAVDWCFEHIEEFHVGWTYRCEFLSKPHHNTLKYNSTPDNNLIVFDINVAEEAYLPYEDKCVEAARIGLQTVRRLMEGKITEHLTVKRLLDRDSALGGTKIEGVVIKNYYRYGADKHVLMGKHVSEAFKEEHSNAWRKANPTGGDIILQVGAKYCHPGRWSKAVQHLRDAGRLEDSPKDIGLLIKEVPVDVYTEHSGEIFAALMAWAWPKLRREITRGLPGWYKEQLMERQFGAEATIAVCNEVIAEAVKLKNPDNRLDGTLPMRKESSTVAEESTRLPLHGRDTNQPVKNTNVKEKQ